MSFSWADDEDSMPQAIVLESLMDCDNSKDGMSAYFKKTLKVAPTKHGKPSVRSFAQVVTASDTPDAKKGTPHGELELEKSGKKKQASSELNVAGTGELDSTKKEGIPPLSVTVTSTNQTPKMNSGRSWSSVVVGSPTNSWTAETPNHIAAAAAAAAAAVNVETPGSRPPKRDRAVDGRLSQESAVSLSGDSASLPASPKRSSSPRKKRTRVTSEGIEDQPEPSAQELMAKNSGNKRLPRAKLLERRQRQIDIGKSTAGYKAYIAMIPKSEREARSTIDRECPNTPRKEKECSKRSWDGQIRKWRRLLHAFDPVDMDREQIDAKNSVKSEIVMDSEACEGDVEEVNRIIT